MSSDKPTPLLQPSIPLYASLYLCGVLSQAGQGSSKSLTVCRPSSIPTFSFFSISISSPLPPCPPFIPPPPASSALWVTPVQSVRVSTQLSFWQPVQVNTPSSPLLLLFLPDPSSLWGSSSQLCVLPGPALLSHCYQTPALFTILFLLYLMPTSSHCHLLFPPCNPLLTLPSITGSSCPLSLPYICLKLT